MTTPAEEADWVTVLTTLPTLPLPPNTERPLIETERLILRPLTEDDLPAFHGLRSRPSVMVNTKRGTVDDNLDFSRDRLAAFLHPNDATSYNVAVCLRAAGDNNNKLIGVGGVRDFCGELGWPEVGYMLHDDHWGKGYATEFLRAFVKAYAALPRPDTPVPLRVSRDSLSAVNTNARAPVVDEMLAAIVADGNARSRGVMVKAGFVEYMTRTESSSADDVLLRYYRYLPGRAAETAATAAT